MLDAHEYAIEFEAGLFGRIGEFERAKLELEFYTVMRLQEQGEVQASAPETYHLPSGYLASQMFADDDETLLGYVIHEDEGADSHRWVKKVSRGG